MSLSGRHDGDYHLSVPFIGRRSKHVGDLHALEIRHDKDIFISLHTSAGLYQLPGTLAHEYVFHFPLLRKMDSYFL